MAWRRYHSHISQISLFSSNLLIVTLGNQTCYPRNRHIIALCCIRVQWTIQIISKWSFLSGDYWMLKVVSKQQQLHWSKVHYMTKDRQTDMITYSVQKSRCHFTPTPKHKQVVRWKIKKIHCLHSQGNTHFIRVNVYIFLRILKI